MQQKSSDTPMGTVAPASDTLLNDVLIQTPQRPTRADGIAVGTFDGHDIDGTALVSIPAFGVSGVRARIVTPIEQAEIGQAVALAFELADPRYPIILGLMLTPSSPSKNASQVSIDGERVVLTGEREIELRCGEAAIILSADGRIELRGTYITSQASATQRILGGSVNIN